MSNEPSEGRIALSPPSSCPASTTCDAPASGFPLVLVVDDIDDNRLLYATTIAEAGYEVEQATNGQEALDKIGSIRPAVIIMDLSMPVLDGWETARRIKADPRTEDILIIAVTAHGTHYGLQEARDAGCEAVLAKPCLPQDLVRVIGALYSTRRAPPHA
jgi:two-component system, cell cycle response regulator DivK